MTDPIKPMNATEVGGAEGGVPEHRLTEVCPVKVCSVEVCPAEIRPLEVGLPEGERDRGILRPPAIPCSHVAPEEVEVVLVCHGISSVRWWLGRPSRAVQLQIAERCTASAEQRLSHAESQPLGCAQVTEQAGKSGLEGVVLLPIGEIRDEVFAHLDSQIFAAVGVKA